MVELSILTSTLALKASVLKLRNMSPLVILFALVAVVAADGPYNSYQSHIPIVSASDNRNPDSSYRFSYASADGSTREEYGDNYNNVQGSYYYISPEGQRITVTYTADANGFHPVGDHLPQSVAKVGPAYNAPKPSYSAPAYQAPAYQAPRPSYSAPAYQAPRQQYRAPAPQYNAPAPVYSAPRPSYSAPAYSAPRPY